MSARKHNFAPVVSDQSKILILGTFPGKQSRESAEYYAHSRNAFWRILSAITGKELANLQYTAKCDHLQSSGIALWDIIASCETEGALDSEIQNETLVDLKQFLAEHPRIRRIYCNGGNAAKYLQRLGPLPVEAVTLPSTSPANARYSVADKLEAWTTAILPLLDHDYIVS